MESNHCFSLFASGFKNPSGCSTASEGPLDTVISSLDRSAILLTTSKRSNSLKLGLKNVFLNLFCFCTASSFPLLDTVTLRYKTLLTDAYFMVLFIWLLSLGRSTVTADHPCQAKGHRGPKSTLPSLPAQCRPWEAQDCPRTIRISLNKSIERA